MPKIIATLRDGDTVEIDAEVGLSIMENLKQGGVDEVAAICGGICSCATCHVFIDGPWTGKLPEQEDDEYDLVSESEHHGPSSRLSCQIEMTDELDGIEVTIAPED